MGARDHGTNGPASPGDDSDGEPERVTDGGVPPRPQIPVVREEDGKEFIARMNPHGHDDSTLILDPASDTDYRTVELTVDELTEQLRDGRISVPDADVPDNGFVGFVYELTKAVGLSPEEVARDL